MNLRVLEHKVLCPWTDSTSQTIFENVDRDMLLKGQQTARESSGFIFRRLEFKSLFPHLLLW